MSINITMLFDCASSRVTRPRENRFVSAMPLHQKGDAGPYHTMTCAMKGLNAEFYDITFTKNKYHDPKHMGT